MFVCNESHLLVDFLNLVELQQSELLSLRDKSKKFRDAPLVHEFDQKTP